MRMRAARTCLSCGAEWSYFERQAFACPDCGSHRSTARSGAPTLHTHGDPEFDLGWLSASLDADPIDAVVELESACRDYLREAGFIENGQLRDLPDRYVTIAELAIAGRYGGTITEAASGDDRFAGYLLALFRGLLEDERPDPEDVPPSAAWILGLGVARAANAYRRDCRRWLRHVAEGRREPTLGSLGDYVARIEALDGEVDPAVSEAVLAATRAVGRAVQSGDEDDRAAARAALAEIPTEL